MTNRDTDCTEIQQFAKGKTEYTEMFTKPNTRQKFL